MYKYFAVSDNGWPLDNNNLVLTTKCFGHNERTARAKVIKQEILTIMIFQWNRKATFSHKIN